MNPHNLTPHSAPPDDKKEMFASCPFCGGERVVKGERYFAMCVDCGATGPERIGDKAGQKKLKVDWNRRASNDNLRSLTPEERKVRDEYIWSQFKDASPSPLQKEVLGSTEEKGLIESHIGNKEAQLRVVVQSLTAERDELKKENIELNNSRLWAMNRGDFFIDKNKEHLDKIQKLEAELIEYQKNSVMTATEIHQRRKIEKLEEALEKIRDLCSITCISFESQSHEAHRIASQAFSTSPGTDLLKELQDYKEALEWLGKKEYDLVKQLRSDDWGVVIMEGYVVKGVGKTPLAAIQAAMSQEQKKETK